MKICVLHRYPISLIRGTNPSFPLFINTLLAGGHEVFFVGFKETEEEGQFKNKIRFREINAYFNRANALDKLIKSLWFTLVTPFMIRNLNREERLDLVYCDDSFPFYGFFIKKITGIKTVIRLGDLQTAYTFADGNALERLIFKVLLALEKMMWKSVDKVVVISQAFKKFLTDNGIPERQIDFVQECIDLELFKPRNANGTLREKYGIGDAPLVMFHGIVAKMKGLDTLLNAIPIILNEKPDVRFLVVGDGGELERLKNKAKSLGIEGSVTFTGWIPFDQIPGHISECDVGIPSRSGNLGNNLIVTTALLQYWAMEKPIVAPRLTAIGTLFGQEPLAGITFEPNNTKDLAEKILQMLETDKKTRNTMGANGRAIAEKRFNIKIVAHKMVEILTQES